MALMKMQFTKEKHTNFLRLKRMKSRQTKMIYLKEINQTNVSIPPKLIGKNVHYN